MKRSIFKLFPTLIEYYENFLTSQECLKILSFCLDQQSILSKHNIINGDGVSSHYSLDCVDILDKLEKNDKTFKNLKKKIKNSLNLYSKENACGGLDLGNSWCNIYQKNSSLLTHVHPDSIVSGALFINVDEFSPSLYFFNPNPHVHFLPTYESSEYNYNYVKFKPAIGSMIIFPSWLFHGSHGEINYTKNRVVISFNSIKSGVRSMDRTGVF